MVTTPGPGPTMLMSVVSFGKALSRLMAPWTPCAKSTGPLAVPASTSLRTCRNEPAPLLLVFVTGVARRFVGSKLRHRTEPTQATRIFDKIGLTHTSDSCLFLCGTGPILSGAAGRAKGANPGAFCHLTIN